MDNFVNQVVSTLSALAFVGVLAWISIALLRRFHQGRGSRKGMPPEGELRFVRALPVGARERVVVLNYRGEEWLIGVTPGGISLLSRSRPGDPATHDAATPAPAQEQAAH